MSCHCQACGSEDPVLWQSWTNFRQWDDHDGMRCVQIQGVVCQSNSGHRVIITCLPNHHRTITYPTGFNRVGIMYCFFFLLFDYICIHLKYSTRNEQYSHHPFFHHINFLIISGCIYFFRPRNIILTVTLPVVIIW